MLIAIGGREDMLGSNTSAIYAFHHDDQNWKHIGDMPFQCSWVDILLLSGGGLLVVDGYTRQVLKITVEGQSSCNETELMRVFSGLAKLFPITPPITRPIISHARKVNER